MMQLLKLIVTSKVAIAVAACEPTFTVINRLTEL